MQAPLLISRRARLCHICAPSDTETIHEALYARIVQETRSPRCQCSSRSGAAKILLRSSQVHTALIIEIFGVRSNASQICARRALLQICSISDACLLTAGVVVKTASAVAEYVLGQQHIVDVNQHRARGVGLMQYVCQYC